MPWEPLPPSFERARRKEIYRRFSRLVTGSARRELLPLEEVQDRLRMFEQTYVGVRPIPVKSIVGSAGRTRDFDKDFLPIRGEARERWQRIERAYPDGNFPPIVVYRLGGSYFVVDGHHRVAIAKQKRIDYIDAEVTEFKTRAPLPEHADIGHIIYASQQHLFMDESGLDRARPEAIVEFSRPDGYLELLELVKVHGFHMMMERGETLAMEEIAGDWYDCVYLPAIEAIRREELQRAFRGNTDADIFLWMWQRRRAVFPERGGMTIEEAIRSLRPGRSGRRRARPPVPGD